MSRVPLAGLGHLVGRFDVDGDVGTGRFWSTMEPEPVQPWPDSSGKCAERAVKGGVRRGRVPRASAAHAHSRLEDSVWEFVLGHCNRAGRMGTTAYE